VKAQGNAAFDLKFTVDTARDIHGLDGSIRKKLYKALTTKLAVDPYGYGTPLRAELLHYYKHEFATHRIIYRIYPDKRLVVICAVGSRKSGDIQDVYNQLTRVVESGRLAAQLQSVLHSILEHGGGKPKKK
jgi:mRNA-degrading endonuclease RelE of RelBE toxin-antitoxin system